MVFMERALAVLERNELKEKENDSINILYIDKQWSTKVCRPKFVEKD